MRKVVTGEELAQVYNPDPFAMPRWRAPVYRTPFGIILVAKFFKLLAWIVRMVARHPLAASVLALAAVTWVKLGWVTLAALVLAIVVLLLAWRWFWPVSFSRRVGRPARAKWRTWCYRRRWAAVMTIAGVAPWYQGRTLLPVLGKVTATRYTDRVYVRLVSGQSAADFAKCAENLAHGFRALLCRVRTARSGAVVLEFIRRDALAALVPALPIPDRPDLKALPVGRREDGLSWLVKLHGTHVLIAGATGAGKASLLWGLVRAMFPLMQDGLVRILAADPKLMELAYGRVIFDSYGAYAADVAAIAAMLDRETKTEASEATLPLPGICVAALRIRDKDQAAAKAAAGDSWTQCGLVFTTRAGTPFEPRNLNRRFETRCAKAGVRRITVHDMRHTCATLLAALDVHPRVAMRILRHAQIDVTMNVYTEVSDARTLKALKRLGRQLGSLPLLYFAAVHHRKRPHPTVGVACDLGRGGRI